MKTLTSILKRLLFISCLPSSRIITQKTEYNIPFENINWPVFILANELIKGRTDIKNIKSHQMFGYLWITDIFFQISHQSAAPAPQPASRSALQLHNVDPDSISRESACQDPTTEKKSDPSAPKSAGWKGTRSTGRHPTYRCRRTGAASWRRGTCGEGNTAQDPPRHRALQALYFFQNPFFSFVTY